MLIQGFLIYFAIAPLSYFVDCYIYHVLQNECSNDVEIYLEPTGINSGIFLQSYKTRWEIRKTDCKFSMFTDPNGGIALCILLTKFKKGCKGNEYLNFSSPQRTVDFCRTFYGYNRQAACFRFDDPNVTLTYNTISGIPPKFRIVANAFIKPPCDIALFKCKKENICIWDGYVCDGFNNCVDDTDESAGTQRPPDCINRSKWIWMIFLSILPLVVISLGGAVFYITWTARHKHCTEAEFVYISSAESVREIRLNALIDEHRRSFVPHQAIEEELRIKPTYKERVKTGKKDKQLNYDQKKG